MSTPSNQLSSLDILKSTEEKSGTYSDFLHWTLLPA